MSGRDTYDDDPGPFESDTPPENTNRVLDRIMALASEYFPAAVLIVPVESGGVMAVGWGHPTFQRGMIRDVATARVTPLVWRGSFQEREDTPE